MTYESWSIVAEPWTAERARSFFDYEAQPKHWGRCDLCNAAWPLFERLAQRDRYGFPVETWRCTMCGLVFQHPDLAPDGLRALYSGPYRALVSAWHGRPINRETMEPEQRDYSWRLIESVEEHLPLEPYLDRFLGRVLDLGGSTGVVARTIIGKLWASEGAVIVEPCLEEAVAALRQPHIDRVVIQSAEDFEASPGSFDLILLCQTVDHLRSISAVLRKVRTWLAPGGRFFVDAVDSSLIPEAERYKIDHVYALTPATMRAYLERAGFVAREVQAPSANHVAFLCEVAA